MQIKDKTTIRMGFSPCPNDTFILDALVNVKISIPDHLNFEWVIEDVEQLNKKALEESLAVTKLSFGVVPLIINNYQLLNAGSALGKACGPLLIYNKKPSNLESSIVGIPNGLSSPLLLGIKTLLILDALPLNINFLAK